MTVRALSRAVCCLVLWASGAAYAAGFEMPDNGTVALGRGGAFTAVADDGLALDYNPAGLAQASGLSFTLDVNQLKNNVQFSRTDPNGGTGLIQNLQVVSNQAQPFTAPNFEIGYARSFITNDRLALYIGVYGPSSEGQYQYPNPAATNNPAADAPNRYQLIQNNIFIAYPSIALAYKLPLPFFLSVGVTGQAVYSSFSFEQDLYTQPSQQTALGASPGTDPATGIPFNQEGVPDCDPCSGSSRHTFSPHPPTGMLYEDPGWDADVKINMKGKLAYTAVLGALAQFGPLKIGASYRPGYHIHATGTLNVGLPAVLTDPTPKAGLDIEAQVQGNQAALDLDWPSVFRGGLDVALPFVPGTWDVSADFTYETWGVVKQLTLTPDNISLITKSLPAQTLGTVVIPMDMQNTQSYRLGTQYQLPIPVVIVQVRAGALYETSAIPEDYTNITFPHFGGPAFTAGASVGFTVGDIIGPLMLDIGGSYSPAVERDVRDSQLSMATSDQYLAKGSDADGNYLSSYYIVSAGLRGHFNL